MAGVDPDKPGPVAEALDFAKRYNSMQPFVFPPVDALPKGTSVTIPNPKDATKPIVVTQNVEVSVVKHYGERANYILGRVNDLFQLMKQKEAAASKDPANVDPTHGSARLRNAINLEQNTLYQDWYQRRFDGAISRRLPVTTTLKSSLKALSNAAATSTALRRK